MEFDGVWVMMNGLSGKMGLDVAAACLRKGFRIAPYAMSGTGSGEVKVSDLEVREKSKRIHRVVTTDLTVGFQAIAFPLLVSMASVPTQA